MTSLSDLSAVLVDRQLLDHPFYRRWQAGDVSVPELAAYAAQYRHFERCLPSFLDNLARALPDGAARDSIHANLADEQGDPVPHVELFERFAQAVDAPADEPPTPATAHLLATYEELLNGSPAAGLAGFVAYETQAAGIAREKADGLRTHHGLDDTAVRFWEHHAAVDERHADWARAALESAGATEDTARHARQAADAWWAFLDEREAMRAA